MDPYHAGIAAAAEVLHEQGHLSADQAEHRVAGSRERRVQPVGLREPARRDNPPIEATRPQPLVDEGVTVGERQRHDRLGNGPARLDLVQDFRQPFGATALSHDQLRSPGGDPGGVAAFVAAVAIGPDHPVAQNDQEFVTIQGFRVEQGRLVGEVYTDIELSGDGPRETDPDVVGVVIAIADEGEGGSFLCRTAGTYRDGGSGHGCQSRTPRGVGQILHIDLQVREPVYYSPPGRGIGQGCLA